MNHPSDLKLERHLLDPEQSHITPHLRECDRCRGRLSEMRSQGEDFRRFVYPATLDAVTRRRWTPMRALWLVAPAAGLATVLMMTRTSPPSGYVGTKGGPLSLTAYVADPSGPKPVADGDTVPSSASLRFRVHASQPCILTLLSVDGAGAVSKLYSREVRGEVTLPGGVQLDGKAGPERFFAVCGADSGAVEQAAHGIGASASRMSSVPGIQGPQASLLIEKKP